MSNKARNTSGKFAAKSETPRKIRSVNLTDDAWQWLADVATKAGVSRNDYLEAMAEGSPLMETVKPQASPFMETVNHALTTPEEALADAAIYGFTPEEALADAHFQINMLQANHDELEDKYEALNRKYSVSLPLIETVQSELDKAKADYAALLESSTAVTNKLREDVQKIRSQLETERADREEVEAELSDLKQNSATAGKELPEAADLLNQLKAKRKKSTVSLADVEAILEMIETS